MSLLISDNLLHSAQLTDAELRVEIALMLFERNKLTLGKASEFAYLSQYEFQKLLGKRKIPIHYDIEELERDLENIKHIKINARS